MAMKNPCINCVLLAMCKTKAIYRLFKDCSLIHKYCRPYGGSKVDRDAVLSVNEVLDRNFRPVSAKTPTSVTYRHLEEDFTVIQDQEVIDLLDNPKLRKEVNGLSV